jgi:metallo-beta-lactamase family protein
VDWDFLLADSAKLYAELRLRVKAVESRPWVDQAELRDRLLDINRTIVELVSEM